MEPIHCSLNSKKSFNKSEVKNLYKIEFYNRGYWSKWYNADTAEGAKNIFKKEFPEAEYKRIKR